MSWKLLPGSLENQYFVEEKSLWQIWIFGREPVWLCKDRWAADQEEMEIQLDFQKAKIPSKRNIKKYNKLQDWRRGSNPSPESLKGKVGLSGCFSGYRRVGRNSKWSSKGTSQGFELNKQESGFWAQAGWIPK